VGLTISAKDMMRYLEARGFYLARTTGHHIMTDGIRKVPVSKHPTEELKPGTIRGIIKSAGLTIEDLKEWMGRE